jgi:serine/threonine protein phosphatase 1
VSLLARLTGRGQQTVRKPAWPAGRRLYAIGDIHGRADLLRELHAMIRADAAAFEGEREIVYMGDFVDRGDDSRQVLDMLIEEPLPGFESIHLMGNHEHALLNFLDDPHAIPGWLSWGGRETLLSYGVSVGFATSDADLPRLRDELERAMPAHHAEFIENLQLFHRGGDYYFVHAGVRPGVSLDKQRFEDQLWIREPFNSSSRDHGAVIVHGHSICEQVEMLPNRIGIDTGAFCTGVLTCLVLEGEEQRLIQTGAAA